MAVDMYICTCTNSAPFGTNITHVLKHSFKIPHLHTHCYLTYAYVGDKTFSNNNGKEFLSLSISA